MRAATAAIPASEADQKLIHRWVLDDVNGTVEDSIGTADGTNNGVVSVDGDWAGGSAGDGGASDNYIQTTPLGTFGSSMSSDFAIAFSVQTQDGSGPVARLADANNMSLSTTLGNALVSAPTGALTFSMADADGNGIQVHTDALTVDDGNQYRVVMNKTSNSASGLEIWTNQTNSSVSNDFDEGFSNTDDFTELFTLYARNNEGSLLAFFDGIIDDYCIFNDSLTQSEIESYENPWS